MKIQLYMIMLLFFTHACAHVHCDFKVHYSEVYFNLRNSLLKKIIYEDKTRAKVMFKTTKILYNKLLSKYYEANEKYYSLSETERNIIDAVISLTY